VVAARGVGLSEGALSYALEFARQREAFGAPIVNLQALQFMFADMAIQIEASRLLTYQAAWLVDQGKFGKEYSHLLSCAKPWRQAAVKARRCDADPALGCMKDHPAEPLPRCPATRDRRGTARSAVIIARAYMDRDLVYN
jgi:alkylation response protein AidB-like acyl-CoA dehydrogenase